MRSRLSPGFTASIVANTNLCSKVRITPHRVETERTDSTPANNFNGNNLIECDQKILQEIGIKKIGDRVRIFVAIKQLRNKAVANRKQKNMV